MSPAIREMLFGANPNRKFDDWEEEHRQAVYITFFLVILKKQKSNNVKIPIIQPCAIFIDCCKSIGILIGSLQ